MSANSTPARLNTAPIVDCVFEIQYQASQLNNEGMPIDVLLPGIFYADLPGPKTIHTVPPLPRELIATDPNLRGIPSFSVEWEGVFINGSHLYISVIKKVPYTRWTDFKKKIEAVHEVLFKKNLLSAIARYSLKYVDFIEHQNWDLSEILKVELFLRGQQVKNEITTLHSEIKVGDFRNVVNIATSAMMNTDIGISRQGMVLTTDTLFIPDKQIPIEDFKQNHSLLLDEIHRCNKNLFFSLLTDKTLKLLELNDE